MIDNLEQIKKILSRSPNDIYYRDIRLNIRIRLRYRYQRLYATDKKWWPVEEIDYIRYNPELGLWRVKWKVAE
jgi:hypothetical protein